MQVRFANSQDAVLIYQFIQDKAEFARSVGAHLGIPLLSVSEIKE